MSSDLENISNAIINRINPIRIYLFGSHANGTSTSKSDYDLCIITNNKNIRKIDMSIEAELALVGITDKATDIIVFYEDEFENRANYLGTLEYTILKEGKLIYGK